MILVIKKNRDRPINIFAFSIWVFGAFMGIVYVQSSLFYVFTKFHTITLFPFLYLFILVLIFYKGIEVSKITKLETCNSPIIYPLVIIIALASYLPFIENVRQLIWGNIDFENISAIKDEFVTGELESRYYMSWLGARLQSLSSYCSFVSPIFLFYYIIKFKKKSKIILIGLVASIINPVLNSMVIGGRGAMIFTMLYFIANYLYFKEILPKRYNRAIKKTIFIFCSVSIAFFIITTIYRFASDKYSDFAISEWLIRYTGESMPNFNAEGWYFKEPTYGKSSFAYFSSFVGGEGVRNLDLLSRITGVRMNVYYTMFGDLMIDFGKVSVLLIVIVFYFISKKVRPNNGIIRLDRFIIFSIFFYSFIAGYFVWPIMNRINGFIGALIVYCLIVITQKRKNMIFKSQNNLFCNV